MRYWVTRAGRDWTPGQPHPGFAEYENGLPTGRVVGEGLMVTVDTPVVEAQVAEAMADPEPKEALAVAPVVLNSGLKRSGRDQHFRDAIAKFDNGGTLTDIEIRHLLQFYGIIIRFAEIVGQPYYLVQQDVERRHERLREIAAARGWTPALMAMYGVLVEGVFEKIC